MRHFLFAFLVVVATGTMVVFADSKDSQVVFEDRITRLVADPRDANQTLVSFRKYDAICRIASLENPLLLAKAKSAMKLRQSVQLTTRVRGMQIVEILVVNR